MSESKPAPCPICKRPAQPRFRPFCTARCADVDLGRWFAEDYRIPASAPDPRAEDDDNITG
jgi:endogenous inhibitor of DNA gyrase (YacG/DUF329 family)